MNNPFASQRRENYTRHARDANSVRKFWRISLRLLALSWIAVVLLGLLDACVPDLM
jgi:hypothetical protein